jgi:hypothetical protein
MRHLKSILENVFFAQENQTINISFERAMGDNIYDTLEKFKNALKNVGIDNFSFQPEAAIASVIVTDDKIDELKKIVSDFKATII